MMVTIGMALLALLMLGVYFTPALLAKDLKATNTVTVLNILFGWTIIIWIILLIWVLSMISKTEVK